MHFVWLSALCTLLIFWIFNPCLAQVTVSVSSTASHAIPTTLWGDMFEDIRYSGDGGLYAELLQNRAFQQVTPGTSDALTAWSSVNGSNITVVADAVSSALPNALEMNVPSGATGYSGFANSGYWGIKVNSLWTYNVSFYYRFPSASKYAGKAVIALTGESGSIYGSTTTELSGSQTDWIQVNLTLKPTSSPGSTNNSFTVSIPDAAGETVHFAMFSLFPPTFKNRENGMRVDLAEILIATQPKFWRFPGGNNLEGESTATRWQWNATVGPLVDRPGRLGTWGYINTDGLGLLEYLYWCEDSGMEPIMGVWDGYALDGVSLLEAELAPYIQQATNQINFVIGDPSKSAPAALRASLGREEPFALKYVEIGNEDFFAQGTYPYRWQDFAGNISAAFPDLQLIATSYPSGPNLTPTPLEWDLHVYKSASWFSSSVFLFDNYERNGTTYFQGEYACVSTAAAGELPYANIESSVSEAAYMTGFERNADIVFAAAYAPLLTNLNAQIVKPKLISFDAGSIYPSTSYYVQKLFGIYPGDEYLPSTLPSSNGTLFWSVTRNTSSHEIYIKIANVGNNSVALNFDLPFDSVSESGTSIILTGNATTANTPTTPTAAIPIRSEIKTGSKFTYESLSWSLSVLIVQIE